MKRLLVSLVIFQILLVAVHLAVYRTVTAVFGAPAAPWNAAFYWLFAVLSFTFLAATLLTRRVSGRLAAGFYKFSVYWFGLINFLFMGAFAFFLVTVILLGFGTYLPGPVLGIPAFGLAIALFIYSAWQALRAETVRIDVALPKLPALWNGRNAVFISDVHLGDVHGVRFAEKVVRKVRALKPYALFIGGDLFDGPACDERALVAPFGELARELPGGVWFITGNHEYYLPDPARAFREIEAAGIRILKNEAADLDGLRVAGVDDKDSADPENFARIMGRLGPDPSRPTVLLKHIPDHIGVAAAHGVSLELCGHTHNGQLFPLQWVVRRIYKGFGYGFARFENGMPVYTSSGVGTWGPPLRFGTRSEIIDLHFSLRDS